MYKDDLHLYYAMKLEIQVISMYDNRQTEIKLN